MYNKNKYYTLILLLFIHSLLIDVSTPMLNHSAVTTIQGKPTPPCVREDPMSLARYGKE
jgi:hypothetical protein